MSLSSVFDKGVRESLQPREEILRLKEGGVFEGEGARVGGARGSEEGGESSTGGDESSTSPMINNDVCLMKKYVRKEIGLLRLRACSEEEEKKNNVWMFLKIIEVDLKNVKTI
jgi:hypothetical protein